MSHELVNPDTDRHDPTRGHEPIDGRQRSLVVGTESQHLIRLSAFDLASGEVARAGVVLNQVELPAVQGLGLRKTGEMASGRVGSCRVV